MRYNSFDEIDNDLKILQLQREINKETIKYSLKGLKTDVYPSNLFHNLKSIVQHYIFNFTIEKFKKLVSLG